MAQVRQPSGPVVELVLLLTIARSCLSAHRGHVPGGAASPPAALKNVLYMMADDMRPEWDVYCPDCGLDTPNINALAKTGLLFTRAYVSLRGMADFHSVDDSMFCERHASTLRQLFDSTGYYGMRRIYFVMFTLGCMFTDAYGSRSRVFLGRLIISYFH